MNLRPAFVEIAIIDMIAIANTIDAIAPNSGTTNVPIISMCDVPLVNGIWSVLSVVVV